MKAVLPDGQAAIFVSDDGTKVAALVTVLSQDPNNNAPRLYWFTSVATSRPVVSFVDLPAGAARDLSCSATAQYCAIASGPLVFVYDTVNKRLRSTVNFGFSTAALCLSPDGQFLGHGFTTMFFYQWSGNNYTAAGSYRPGNSQIYLTGSCAISTNGVAAVAWSNGDYSEKLATVFTIKLNKLTVLFSHNFGQNKNPHLQDVPSATAISPDGSYFAFSSWGDGGNAATVAVFNTIRRSLVYSLATVGSMNDIDLYISGGNVWVTAGGKATHNNVMGDGGDLYSIMLGPNGPAPTSQ